MRQIGSIRYDFEKCTFGGGGLCVSAPEIALFALSLRAEDGTQTKLNGQNAAFDGLDERGGTLTAHYSFECGVHVRLHIACSGERTAFRLDADVPADRKLEWAEYAPVCVPPLLERDGEGGRGKILWPYNEGALLSRLRDRESDFLRYREPEYPSLGSDGIYPNMVESQFLAYLAGGEGIYLGAHDSQCGTKSIDFEQRENCIYLRIRAYTDTGFGENYAAAYDTVIQAFKGDWMDAADIYAEWFAEGTGAAFKKSHENPDLPACCQQAEMDEAARAAFLAQFAPAPTAPLLGFAVLGGVFGEGVDLAGDRLIGAAIVGPGLPQVGPRQEQLRDYFEQTRGSGFDYAYRYPGMNKVLQAAGRVIRTPRDKGVVLLIDSRFALPDYRRLMPPHWSGLAFADTPAQLAAMLEDFWKEENDAAAED